ncbi:MAG TPA: hypothetical protein VGM38_07700 [Pseudolysinimonas sp.]|jgi:hypothetical protein
MTDSAMDPRALADRVAAILGTQVDAVVSADELASSQNPALLVIRGVDAADLLSLDPVIAGRSAPTALIISDGYLGTEGPDVPSALAGAAAVALARSIAVRRHTTGRVNVVCVPESLVGDAGSQRGPLTIDDPAGAVADVVAFVLGPDSSYIDGQVLYANGGRHLFSSLTA